MIKRLCLGLLLSCVGIGAYAKEATQSPTSSVTQEERYKFTAYIKPQQVLQQSHEFQDRKKQIQDEITERGKKIEKQAYDIYQEKQKLQEEAQELQNSGKTKFTKSETQQRNVSEIREREAELKKQENNIEYDYQRLQEDGKNKEQEIYAEMQKKMMQAAERVGQEQGWGAVDIASLYVAPSLDITDDVAQAMNKEYREREASKQHATQQTEKQQDKGTAAAAA